MAKVHPFYDHDGKHINLWAFQCPGCGYDHGLQIRQYVEGGNPQWTFNGDVDRPTFSPSLLIYKGSREEGITQCHSFIRDGKIEFLSDCLHSLAGQTVEIPEYGSMDG